MKQAVVHAASVLSLRFWPRHHLMRRVALGKHLNSDGHLITEDSVLPTTAPGGAPEQNRCYQTPAYFYLFSPLRPLRSRARRTSHRSLRYAPAGGWRGLVFVLVSS